MGKDEKYCIIPGNEKFISMCSSGVNSGVCNSTGFVIHVNKDVIVVTLFSAN
jgi:hypothetical protein